jgi:hypothetical protein
LPSVHIPTSRSREWKTICAEFNDRVRASERVITSLAAKDELCQRLMTVPGVGASHIMLGASSFWNRVVCLVRAAPATISE